MSRILPARLKSISSFRDRSAAWAVLASVVSHLNPTKDQDLLAYFILISGAAESGDFDWLSYDSKFRRGVAVPSDPGHLVNAGVFLTLQFGFSAWEKIILSV